MQIFTVFLIILFGQTTWQFAAVELLYIAGLWGMFKKSGVPGWWALIPCAREYKLAVCAGREPEGRVTSITNFLVIIVNLATLVVQTETTSLLLSVFMLMLLIVWLVYSVRVYNGLMEVYGKRNILLLPWMIIHALPAMI